jgi:hypothetical protein
MQYLNITQLADLLGVSRRAVQRRAIREDWPYKELVVLGGRARLYQRSALPPKIARKVTVAQIVRRPLWGVSADALSNIDARTVYEYCAAQPMDKTKLNRFDVKLKLLDLSRLFVFAFHGGKRKPKGLKIFCRCYNDRSLSIDAAFYGFVDSLSYLKLWRWVENEDSFRQQSNQLPQVDGFNNDALIMIDTYLQDPQNTAIDNLSLNLSCLFRQNEYPSDAQQLRKWLATRQPKPHQGDACCHGAEN